MASSRKMDTCIYKNVQSLVDYETVAKYSDLLFWRTFRDIHAIIATKHYFQCIYVRQVPWEMLKTTFALSPTGPCMERKCITTLSDSIFIQ